MSFVKVIEILLDMIIFLNRAGLNLYFKHYGRVRVEGDLLSGVISAVRSVSLEALGDEVREIRAGERTFHIREAEGVIVAVSTVYPLNPADMQALLSELLAVFINKYRGVLENWVGNTAEFADADEVIEPVVQEFEKKYDQFRKKCAMILTLGATPEPLIKTINSFRPDYVCFLSTKDMLKHLSEVLEVTGANEGRYEYNYYQIEDKNDISHCLRVSEQAFDELFRRGFSVEDIYVDITGGTKVMAGGLCMAAVKYYSRIVYVGGEKRDEIGRVITGTERIYFAYNPYEFFASKQIERGLELFNDYRWRTAIEVFDEARNHLGEGKEKKLATIFRDLTIAYGLWDRFHYRVAVRVLENVRNVLHDFCNILPSRPLEKLCDHININLGALCTLELVEKVEGATYPAIIVDMFNNAVRRAKELAFDDALTRLYRLTEMLAQYKLMKDHRINASDVDLEKIKPRNKELTEKLSQMRGEDGKIKLGLKESYSLLNSLIDNPKKRDLQNRLLDLILQTRNKSILAHGVSPTYAENFEQLKKLTETLLKEEIPEFEKTMQELQFPQLHEDLEEYLKETSKK